VRERYEICLEKAKEIIVGVLIREGICGQGRTEEPLLKGSQLVLDRLEHLC
jgi:hypothetical protein